MIYMFDIDGTLTKPRQKMDEKFEQLFLRAMHGNTLCEVTAIIMYSLVNKKEEDLNDFQKNIIIFSKLLTKYKSTKSFVFSVENINPTIKQSEMTDKILNFFPEGISKTKINNFIEDIKSLHGEPKVESVHTGTIIISNEFIEYELENLKKVLNKKDIDVLWVKANFSDLVVKSYFYDKYYVPWKNEQEQLIKSKNMENNLVWDKKYGIF